MNPIRKIVIVKNDSTEPNCGKQCRICKQYIDNIYDFNDIIKRYPFHPNCNCKLRTVNVNEHTGEIEDLEEEN
jgi:hypothetical protein